MPDDDDEIDESDDSYIVNAFNESEEHCWAGEYEDDLAYLEANNEPEDEDG